MELICATDEEINFLVEFLSEFMITCRAKEHNKPNGYKAKHCYSYLDPEKHDLLRDSNFNMPILEDTDLMPVVEIQLKTIEVAIKSINGSASHSNYKHTDREQIQKDFDNHDLKVGFNLPFMWVSSNDMDTPQMKLLSADETAKVLYPFIDMTNREKENKTI